MEYPTQIHRIGDTDKEFNQCDIYVKPSNDTEGKGKTSNNNSSVNIRRNTSKRNIKELEIMVFCDDDSKLKYIIETMLKKDIKVKSIIKPKGNTGTFTLVFHFPK